MAAAQVSADRGDLEGNIQRHLAAITAAASQDVCVLAFPELSLMGYEPDLAKELQLSPTDPRLQRIAVLAERYQMQIIVGSSLMSGQATPYLGAIVFGVDGKRRTYAKMHLGGSESAYFTPGTERLSIESHGHSIGLSICADSSQRSHPAAYASSGASAYVASVFLNAPWYATDSPRFATYAAELRMLVLMANHADSIGTLTSVGKSAAWAPDGSLLARADGVDPALVVVTLAEDHWSGHVVPL